MASLPVIAPLTQLSRVSLRWYAQLVRHARVLPECKRFSALSDIRTAFRASAGVEDPKAIQELHKVGWCVVCKSSCTLL